jgi:peptidoglycan hydrolase CwlO-like protein
MINYQLTKEDIEFIEKAVELKNKGFYIDSQQLTDHYNRILNKRVNNTTCGSCMRQRVSELENALNQFKASEAKKAQELNNIKAEENKAAVEAGNEDIKARMARVRAARGKKK